MSTDNKSVTPQDQSLAASLIGAANQGGADQSKAAEGAAAPAANIEGEGAADKPADKPQPNAKQGTGNKPAPQAPAAKTLKAGQVAVDSDEFEQFKAFQKQQRIKKEQENAGLQKIKLDSQALQARRAEIAKTYGPDFILAKGKDGVERPFTRMTWDLLGGDKNKEGLKRVIDTPPEVINAAK